MPTTTHRKAIRNSNFEIRNLLKSAAEVLKKGGVVVIPTDTVYGLAALAFDRKAVERIYRLKGRSYDKPLVIFGSRLSAFSPLVSVPDFAKRLIRKFWPGPLTLVFPASPLGRLLSRGKSTLALRIPDHPAALGILKEAGAPLATTSANLSGGKSPIKASQIPAAIRSRADLVVDCGACPLGAESSILDVSSFPPVLLREGALSRQEIYRAIH